MSLPTILSSFLGSRGDCRARGRRQALQVRLAVNGLECLERRDQPSTSPVDLGAANHFGVLGLRGTIIDNGSSTVSGNVGVSQWGAVWNDSHSAITGDVDEARRFEYFGRGKLGGSLIVDAKLMNNADHDALVASAAAARLTATQTFGEIDRPRTITGNGGVNVINIRGDLESSLMLNGSANDVFIINVRGDLHLGRNGVLGLTGGVTADHVLYNVLGRRGSVTAGRNAEINGTLLAPSLTVDLNGTTVNGAVISGGQAIELGFGAHVNQHSFNPNTNPPVDPNLSGFVFIDYNGNGVMDPLDNGDTATVTLLDSAGNVVLDANGNPVTAATVADGSYTFVGLAAGIYGLRFGTLSGTPVVGTVGGTASGSVFDSHTITGINLTAAGGTGYNFAETPSG